MHQGLAVTQTSSCQVHTISRQGIKTFGAPLDSNCIFILFPMKVARGLGHSSWEPLMTAMNQFTNYRLSILQNISVTKIHGQFEEIVLLLVLHPLRS